MIPASSVAKVQGSTIQDSLLRHLRKERPDKLVIPAAMLGLGALALENRYLQYFNKSIRHEILESNPNTDNHIEDRLRYLPAASAFLLQVIGVKGKHKLTDKVMLYALSTTVLHRSVDVLKNATRELRPDGSDRRSFPSGHTATAFAAAEFMRLEYKDVSPWLVVGAYTAATATGALRVYHNKHWATDVIAGAGLGILSTNLIYSSYSKIKYMQRGKKTGNHLIIAPAFKDKKLGIGATYLLRKN